MSDGLFTCVLKVAFTYYLCHSMYPIAFRQYCIAFEQSTWSHILQHQAEVQRASATSKLSYMYFAQHTSLRSLVHVSTPWPWTIRKQRYTNDSIIIRQPRTVPEGFMFYYRCFYLFASPGDLRDPSADRCKTFSTWSVCRCVL